MNRQTDIVLAFDENDVAGTASNRAVRPGTIDPAQFGAVATDQPRHIMLTSTGQQRGRVRPDTGTVMHTGLADASRTLAPMQGKNDDNAVPGTAASSLNTDIDALPPVFVEPEEGTDKLLVSFDDEIAHLHEDLVQRCLTYCRGFPGVHEAVWTDREIISLAGEDIAFEPLQADLLSMVEDVLEAVAAEDAEDDGDS